MSDTVTGALLAGVAAVAWGSTAVLVRLGLRHMPSTVGTLVSQAAGLGLFTALALALRWTEVVSLPPSLFPWLALLGVVNFALGRALNFSALQRIGVGRASPLVGTAPLFATLYALLFLGERVTPLLLVGTLAIVMGIALVLSDG